VLSCVENKSLGHFKNVFDARDYKSGMSVAMFTIHSYTWRSSEHSRLLRNHRWFPVFAALILLLAARPPTNAQTSEATRVTVTGEAIPTPTPYDSWREMRQHIMPEVSGTQITVTKKQP
jgi:hypothetical protein